MTSVWKHKCNISWLVGSHITYPATVQFKLQHLFAGEFTDHLLWCCLDHLPWCCQITYPGDAQITYPGAAQIIYSGAAHITYPGAAHITYPGAAHITYPGAAHITYPGAAQIIYPGAAHITYPGAAQIIYPGAAQIIYPGAAQIIYPGAAQIIYCNFRTISRDFFPQLWTLRLKQRMWLIYGFFFDSRSITLSSAVSFFSTRIHTRCRDTNMLVFSLFQKFLRNLYPSSSIV